MPNYDLIIIGGGPGGYVAAIRAAQLGAKVALIEKDQVGGTCLNRGCIPTKAIIACISLYEQITKAANFGIKTDTPSVDLKTVVERKDKIVTKLVMGIEFLLQKNKIELIKGTAKVLEPGKVEIEKADSRKQIVESRKIILASGSSPAQIPGITLDSDKFLCSNDILNLQQVPEKLDIVGGGVIGIHFAHIFSTLGTQVTVYEALPEILPGVDEEIVVLIKRILKRKKINLVTNSRFEAGQSCGKTLICVGRTPNTQGLETLNLNMEGKSITVNEKLETSIPGIYAVGDLVSKKLLAHVAYEQGAIAAENALGADRKFSYDYIPCGIYTNPEIGLVGLTEKEAREKFNNIKVGKFPFGALGIAQALGEIEGFIKVVADESGKILGVHIIGPEANNILGGAVLAVKNGLNIERLAETFQAHPSYPEGLQEAALCALSQAIHTI
ncbi:dihydrolipoyl dehydrogenase [candidate division WOR-1 bacterium RIFOXYB2_FULL_42_35]|uniref:Dihydrolipoyl dehydrogenase n=1 Tax=candidate division WOR-1 bacterium RIFOXYC2_FULL_41_25 TaxID=1802586 RepID=A0A1F4TP72_UNCSA|nr:MAG: dihydrolipoyl dehydrogenase [candidate division WOR-1 bacterium RIFOXYA2_FULL_41_14]OGC25088.1 MAG: dihydrolipoyl dehydrogenase [candidate division WOR-1 bacterium RIFOXYB2_FULL_42_35]OGC34488.1 MAG: dihydrolipoyl dehydrogenase [candidate division WOR-1 bacterium RIFOXYC2_FULL_41_25]OGC43872.1 MAG: dihydrolipoyl dehydrogenase [candidate division WOR-1 bacterium RIFOXYD2_FULL_41_8]